MVTTVMIGRLIAKSEFSMTFSRRGTRGRGTRDPGAGSWSRCRWRLVSRHSSLVPRLSSLVTPYPCNCAHRDPLRRPQQQRIARHHTAGDLVALPRLVVDTERDLDALDAAALHAHHRRAEAARVHGAPGNDHARPPLGRDAALGEEACHERALVV